MLIVIIECLQGVVIENCDVFVLMEYYDWLNMLYYVDLFYVYLICSMKVCYNVIGKLYWYELDDNQYKELVVFFKWLCGMVVFFGYFCLFYDEFYSIWYRVDCYVYVDGFRE